MVEAGKDTKVLDTGKGQTEIGGKEAFAVSGGSC